MEGLPGRLVDFSVDHVCLWLEGLIFVRSSGCTPCPLSLSLLGPLLWIGDAGFVFESDFVFLFEASLLCEAYL